MNNWKNDLDEFKRNNSWEINKLKGVDVCHYIIDNYQPKIVETIKWHIEDYALTDSGSDYDRGWNDAMQLILNYYEEK